MIEAGVNRADEQVQAGHSLLVAKARADGGWSKPELESAVSLTLVTCLALQAGESLRLDHSDPMIQSGVEWLIAAQNDDGGWGNLEQDQRSDVTSTSYAIRALAASDTLAALCRRELDSAITYLFNQRREDGSWGPDNRGNSTVVHSSHAVEALLTAGCSLKELTETKAWLLVSAATQNFTPWLEQYNLAVRSSTAPRLPERLSRSRLNWTHLPAERSLIALLRLGVDPASTIVSAAVTNVIERHHRDGYWEIPTVPGTAPSWAILEAVRSLSLYGETIERSRGLVAVRNETNELAVRVAHLEKARQLADDERDEILTRVEALEQQRSKLLRLGGAVSLIQRIVKSSIFWTILVLLLTAGALWLYVEFWADGSKAGEKAVGVATILASSLAALALVRYKGKP
ncbi:prenyltransferase/squalene oxidase repeat-containing protein [Amycolatopsis mediterranei]|uniref:prenyltransferase/squalene oxidase repeat-containing protein n=1 Tax=Amycolatopsis mediterranei TaxID=33910 RepID=UPI00343C98FD